MSYVARAAVGALAQLLDVLIRYSHAVCTHDCIAQCPFFAHYIYLCGVWLVKETQIDNGKKFSFGLVHSINISKQRRTERRRKL